MNIVPKRNLLTDRQERDLAIQMAGGIHADKARISDALAKVRHMTNVRDFSQHRNGGPLSRRQEATLARELAGGKHASRGDKRVALAKIRTITGMQQKQAEPKRNLVAKPTPAQPQRQREKTAFKAPARSTPANDNKVKALKPGQPGVIQFNGRTFVHKSQLPGAKAAAAPSAPKRNIVAPVTKSTPPPPTRERGRGRSR